MKVERVIGIDPTTMAEGYKTNRKNEIKQMDNKEFNIGRAVEGMGMGQEAKEQPVLGEEAIIRAIEQANSTLRGVDKRFEFSIHEGTREIMVKVIDDATNEVIREIPPEKILDMVAKMWELAGILVDRKI